MLRISVAYGVEYLCITWFEEEDYFNISYGQVVVQGSTKKLLKLNDDWCRLNKKDKGGSKMPSVYILKVDWVPCIVNRLYKLVMISWIRVCH